MQPTPEVVPAVVFLPFLATASTPVVYRLFDERTAHLVAAVASVTLDLVTDLYLVGVYGTVLLEWIPSLRILLAFHVDGPALLIAFLASGVGVFILTYSGGYMYGELGQAKYHAALLAFTGSMLGVVLAGDLVTLFTFWELASLSSFILTGHYTGEKAPQYAARKSMLIAVSDGPFTLVGFPPLVWVSGQMGVIEGTMYSIPVLVEHTDATREVLTTSGSLVPVFALIGLGAATKSAQVPPHVWLPSAMEVPTPVSALLHSATMAKVGVYLVGRLHPLFLPENAVVFGKWMFTFAMLGLLTMTAAAIPAVSATDIKELFVYSTASHLGLIIAAFGFASSYGTEADAFHILNHASFKAMLFMVAGIIVHEVGTRNIDRLGGLRKHLPVTAVITVVASLSVAGFPPFNGFYSKELLFESAYYAAEHMGGVAWIFPVVAAFGSVFMFLYSIKFASLFFDGEPDGLGHVHRPPAVMLVPPATLGALILATSAQPNLFIEGLIGDVYDSVVPGEARSFLVYFPTELTPYVIMSLIIIIVGAAAFPFYDRVHDAINAALHGPVRANWWYDNFVEGLTMTSVVVTPKIQTGPLHIYATWGLFGFAVLALDGYAATGVSMPGFSAFSVSIPIVFVLFVALIAALAVDVALLHVAGVLTLPIVGFTVAILYILADAPDFALTQLVVGTLVLVVFLLILDCLPTFYGDASDRLVSVCDGLLSLVVGGTVFFTVLLSTDASPDPLL